MNIQPKIRGFICTTAHPQGCMQHVNEQIQYVAQFPALTNAPKKVLVIGASTGYGLASRIVAAFGGQAKTIGVFLKKKPRANVPHQRVGITVRVLNNKRMPKAYMQKALTEMRFQMTSNKKPSTL